jgi:hypothetical protein
VPARAAPPRRQPGRAPGRGGRRGGPRVRPAAPAADVARAHGQAPVLPGPAAQSGPLQRPAGHRPPGRICYGRVPARWCARHASGWAQVRAVDAPPQPARRSRGASRAAKYWQPCQCLRPRRSHAPEPASAAEAPAEREPGHPPGGCEAALVAAARRGRLAQALAALAGRPGQPRSARGGGRAGSARPLGGSEILTCLLEAAAPLLRWRPKGLRRG